MGFLWQDTRIRVALGLVIGLAVIIYKYPPHTPCTSQIEAYTDFYLKAAETFGSKMNMCKDHPDPGGCVGFFEVVKKFEDKFNEVSNQCQSELAGAPVKVRWISLAMEIYVRLAWGAQGPESSAFRKGWLDANQVAQFCRLKRDLESVFGKDEWNNFAPNLLTELPHAKEVQAQTSYNELWARSLMADSCSYAF